jgi:hypothetical protein
MKIKAITIQGFRGFNEEREIQFDDRLTLIAAVNSYGKTSISEAFEWLLYGQTSKVEKADSKDEYKGSYANCHLSPALNPTVTLVLVDQGVENTLRAELVNDEIQRTLNGVHVAGWSFASAMADLPKPFILQHALKNLLLAKPVDRFNDFARLLGFEELGDLRKEIISLCTQFRAPQKAAQLISSVDALQSRLQSQPSFAPIAKEIKRGTKGLKKAYELISKECTTRVPPGTSSNSFLPRLIQVRNDAVGKIFKGSVSIAPYTAEDQSADTTDENILVNETVAELTPKYSTLITLKTQQFISDLVTFYDLGIKLLVPEPTTCPFCMQEITAAQRDHISEKHSQIQERAKSVADLSNSRIETQQSIRNLQTRLTRYVARNLARSSALLSVEPLLGQIDKLLQPKFDIQRNQIHARLPLVKDAKSKCDNAMSAVTISLAAVSESITKGEENLELLTTLAQSLIPLVNEVRGYRTLLQQSESELATADGILGHELDAVAGTQEVSILIDLLESRQNIERRFRIADIVEGLKVLRSQTEDFVGKRMLDAISGEFTNEVMEWYGKIRTTGDPDVHFAGFDMKKAATGNRVQIKATSYGRDLVSAVSSLSESKLNALGLCISIAINLKAQTPFEFLIIDDPIQSWDQDHETKFIDVIRELVNEGRQVVLLSHNQQWIKQVRSTCGDLNGMCYQITGYTEEGPHIVEVAWAEAKQRLSVIDGILKNPQAGPVELQQAEEEIRLVINQLAGELNVKKFGTAINTKNMTPDKVQKVLLACGVAKEPVTKLVAAFGTVDPAHHSQADYAVSRERIQEYQGRAIALAQIVATTPAAAKKAATGD